MIKTKRNIQEKYREQIELKHNKGIILTIFLTVLLGLSLIFAPSAFKDIGKLKSFEDIWRPVIFDLNQALSNESDVYQSIHVNYEVSPVQVTINTTLGKQDKKEINQLFKISTSFINSITIHKSVDGKRYEIIILDKNGKELTRKTF